VPTVKEFRGKVAVITGAASGIGRALAERCAREGMSVVLADIEKPALLQTESQMRESGANVLAVRTDVSKARDVERLARRTLDAFGAVHLLCNNAGVWAGTTAWESTLNDWKWTLGVNLWGVVHSLRAFVPVMLAQDADAHIVNTASIGGLLPDHANAAYHASKHAVVAISEKLYYDLAERGGRIKVSVLCPGWVQTAILDARRNRPPELENAPSERITTPEEEAAVQEELHAARTGMSPEHVAECVFRAIQEEQFYILTHPEHKPVLKARMEAMVQGRNPLPAAELWALMGR
jgi:NAD(P)-dependent dehydrogenase (short-subunit alcohol dehydrogenase family)